MLCFVAAQWISWQTYIQTMQKSTKNHFKSFHSSAIVKTVKIFWVLTTKKVITPTKWTIFEQGTYHIWSTSEFCIHFLLCHTLNYHSKHSLNLFFMLNNFEHIIISWCVILEYCTLYNLHVHRGKTSQVGERNYLD